MLLLAAARAPAVRQIAMRAAMGRTGAVWPISGYGLGGNRNPLVDTVTPFCRRADTVQDLFLASTRLIGQSRSPVPNIDSRRRHARRPYGRTVAPTRCGDSRHPTQRPWDYGVAYRARSLGRTPRTAGAVLCNGSSVPVHPHRMLKVCMRTDCRARPETGLGQADRRIFRF